MRRLMKFLHTMGAIGLMGAMACLIALLSVTPPPAILSGYAQMRGAMAAVATWVFLPSLALMLVAGLLAIALNRAFHQAGWAWVKLATGVLMFEYGFVGVQGPMQREAERSAGRWPAGSIRRPWPNRSGPSGARCGCSSRSRR